MSEYLNKIIVVYEVNDYPEMGGGTNVRFFDTEREAIDFLNQTVIGDKDRYTIIIVARIGREYKIKEKEVVKEFSLE